MSSNPPTEQFEVADGYSISGYKCRLIFRNAQSDILAVTAGCAGRINAIYPQDNHRFSETEKDILRQFVLEHKIALGTDAADKLEMSVLRYTDGHEECLTEAMLKRLLHTTLNVESLYIGHFKAATLEIPSYSQIPMLSVRHAQIKKLIIRDNCDLQIDARDNQELHTVHIGKNYNGGINLSRSRTANVVIGDNCRCDLTAVDTPDCLNINIGAIYSGNLNVKNSYLQMLRIGYYSYAAINISSGRGQGSIVIGDSFRGGLETDNVAADVYIGKDCKGTIKIGQADYKSAGQSINIDDDFNGTMDLHGNNIRELNVGQRAAGKFYLWGNGGVRRALFGAYFSGMADFSESMIEYLDIGGGSAGSVVLRGCLNLKLFRVGRYNNLKLQLWREPLQIRYDDNFLYYYFIEKISEYDQCLPLYQKFYLQMKNAFENYFRQ